MILPADHVAITESHEGLFKSGSAWRNKLNMLYFKKVVAIQVQSRGRPMSLAAEEDVCQLKQLLTEYTAGYTVNNQCAECGVAARTLYVEPATFTLECSATMGQSAEIGHALI
ncbi:hypothetical protein ABBQ38_005716 [Trebouxia sp. C0009 RCD-2024]